MKKIKKLLSLCGIICLILCSCEEVPDTLRSTENTNINVIGTDIKYNDYTSSLNNFNTDTATEKVEKGSIDIIRSQIDADLTKKYDNIKIKNARVGEGTIMPAYDIKIGGNPNFDFKNVVRYLYDDKVDINNESNWEFAKKGDPMDESRPVTFEPTYSENGILTPNSNDFDINAFYADKNRDYTFSSFSYSTGAVWGSETGGGLNSPYYDHYSGKLAEKYDLKYTKPSDILSYKMTDGNEWNVTEAIVFVENFWNTYLSPSDPQKYEYSVKTLFVIQLSEDTYGYLFELERKDENGNYFDVDSMYIQDNEAIETGKPFKVGNAQMTWAIGKEVITRYIKNYSICYEKQTNEGNELLTLGKAADILSDSLAPNINLDIYSAELNYVIVCKKYPFFETWEYPWYYESICLTRCDFEIKPYWCFRTNKSTLLNPNDCEIYFIDAKTGELSVMLI